jgi:chromosome partitioning protein
MRAILIANAKGGVGKTTVSLTLAAALARNGGRVALADADKQGSSLRWLSARPHDAAPIRALDWRRDKAVGDAPKKLDWLVIDAPGALRGERAEALVAEARALVVPVAPSVFDLAATEAFLARLEEIKRVRKGKAVPHVVANRVRRGRAAVSLLAALEEGGHAPVATLPDRTAYADLAAQGLSVFDRDRKADRDLQAPWLPLLAALGG